jgi:branched-chain amino acid transport system permease protein
MLALSAVVNGILYGGVLALLVLGLNLMFGVVQIIHFFYGQLLMVGLYLIYVFTIWCHIPLILSCLLTVGVLLLINTLVHVLVVKRLLTADLINQFLALASVMLILENLCQAIFGTDIKGIPINLPVMNIGELYFTTSNLIAFVGSLVFAALFYIFLNKTYIGLAIRAVAQDKEVAGFMGINIYNIYIVTMALGGGLVGIVAAFFTPIYSVYPHFGGSFTLISFIIVVLGGMGNLLGGFIAAFIIGVITILVSTFSNTEIGLIVSYLIFLFVILIRPQGILGAKVSR